MTSKRVRAVALDYGGAVALDYGGNAVAFRLSQCRSKDRQMTCRALSILDRNHGLLARGQGHYGG